MVEENKFYLLAEDIKDMSQHIETLSNEDSLKYISDLYCRWIENNIISLTRKSLDSDSRESWAIGENERRKIFVTLRNRLNYIIFRDDRTKNDTFKNLDAIESTVSKLYIERTENKEFQNINEIKLKSRRAINQIRFLIEIIIE
ncbi:hypothetical protein GF376_03275 [Candidatus Peregrinibacteria bacterium]|nr:hypothetical protein [Candidatus Peregrinibacteria bacterium]